MSYLHTLHFLDESGTFGDDRKAGIKSLLISRHILTTACVMSVGHGEFVVMAHSTALSFFNHTFCLANNSLTTCNNS